MGGEAVAGEAAQGEEPGASGGTAVRRKAATGPGAGRGKAAQAGTGGEAGVEEESGGRGDVSGKKAAAKRSAARKATKKAASAAEAAQQTGARTVAAKKTAGRVSGGAGSAVAVPTARAAAATPAGELAVRPGEDPWTPEEVAEARAELAGEAARLTAEITSSETALVGLMRDSGDGAGDDEADTGTKNITREHEMALAANAREMLEQTERALQRLDAGTYGLCESCGKPIGKARMQAFPRATLCVECKQKQERRS
ncbi:TraR/DksA C4-type zinc finger protein [Streptomyces sp. PKU-EA00015]|nr:TraR/DksA C4-type zinc finger protein [Streptomyces sp. PKU-EA00015]